MCIPYSRKIWLGIKFGGLAVYLCNRQIKMRQYFILAYIHVAIPYRTAKFKSANIFAIAIWGPTAKFNSRQYFRLYGMHVGIETHSLASRPLPFAQRWMYCITSTRKEGSGDSCTVFVCSWNAIKHEVT